jgi:hypothetical protein
MARNLISKYIWLVDTIQRYGKITREDLNDLWIKSALSDGEPMPRRTFYNYRNGLLDTFNISIECDRSTFEYYIDSDGSEQSSKMLNWLLDSASMSGMLSDSKDVGDRIILEDVPSARENLPLMIQAIKQSNRITFAYRPYTRVNEDRNVVIEPYCVRIFKQLWYVIGFNVRDSKIKTYSLDRMTDPRLLSETFVMPDDFEPLSYFTDCFGIMTSKGEAKDVVIRANAYKAKYLRALPLHHSQSEEIHDSYSLFHYHLYLTNDFLQEILSHGSAVQVLAPTELKIMVKNELKNALEAYD